MSKYDDLVKMTGEQWLNFVDPKGLRQMNLNDPKLGLYKEVKVLQDKLGDSKLTLNAFIVSGTQFASAAECLLQAGRPGRAECLVYA